VRPNYRARFLRKKLIDHISVFVAPALIGGINTSTLIDGESLHYDKDLVDVKALKLKSCKVLKDSYLHLYYDVINETEIEPYNFQVFSSVDYDC
jgi:2,5-diamino-6-(ribosylamino)-4(3H)-pyrimidinone 5'-phosphate reductase